MNHLEQLAEIHGLLREAAEVRSDDPRRAFELSDRACFRVHALYVKMGGRPDRVHEIGKKDPGRHVGLYLVKR